MDDLPKTSFRNWFRPAPWFAVALFLFTVHALKPDTAPLPNADAIQDSPNSIPTHPTISLESPDTPAPVTTATVVPSSPPRLSCYRPTAVALDAPPPLGLGAVFGRAWKQGLNGLEPAGGTRVEARSEFWQSATHCDDAGWFRFELPPGNYRIQSFLAGQGSAAAVMARVQFQTQRVTLVVKPSGRVVGVVTFEGAVLEGAQVELLTEAHKVSLGRVSTDDEGRFEFQGLPQELNVLVSVSGKTPEGNPTIPTQSGTVRLTLQVPRADLVFDLKRGSSADFRVTASDTGVPLKGVRAIVSFQVSRRAKTGPRGRFAVHGLPEGEYSVNLLARDHFPSLTAFKVDGEQSLVDEQIELKPVPEGPKGRVRGVLRNRHHEPIAGAHVSLVLTRPDQVTRLTFFKQTTSAGTFEFDDLRMGSVQMEFSKPGFKLNSKEFGLSRSQPEANLRVFLQKEAAISGTVLLENGAWGASVRVLGSGSNARTDVSGRFRFADLPPGAHTIEATAPGYTPLQKTVMLTELPPGPNVVLQLTRGVRTVSGWVLGATGRPLAGASVGLVQRGDVNDPTGWSRWTTRTDAEGAFLFEELPPASLAISAGTRGKLLLGEQISTEVGHAWGVALRLDQPAPNFTLLATAPPPPTPSATTAHDGCALARTEQRARLRPEIRAAAEDLWEHLIGRDGARFHIETATALLRERTHRSCRRDLQDVARAALAAAWTLTPDAKAQAGASVAAKHRLLALFDAGSSEAAEPVVTQFLQRVQSTVDGIQLACQRLHASLKGLGLTPPQIGCVSERVFENTVARAGLNALRSDPVAAGIEERSERE